MTRNLKILTSVIFASVLFHSCKKSNGLSERDALTQHDWYPYQSHIDYSDTILVTTTDNGGQPHTRSTIFKFDTTYILDPCFQQSNFSFQSNGRLEIRNMCSVGQLTIDTNWTTMDNRLTYLLFIKDSTADALLSKLVPYTMFAGNPSLDLEIFNIAITKINSSGFEVQQLVTDNLSESYYVNNSRVDSLIKIHNNREIAFKSR